MVRIHYPEHDFRIRTEEGKETIFDELRRKWIRLTPEEWVRQNMLQYLLKVRSYPAKLIAIEKEILLGELRKRFDILVYHNDKPWMVIECKEMNVLLTEAVLRQALNYNIGLQTTFLTVTNGREVYAFHLSNGAAEMLAEFPDYPK